MSLENLKTQNPLQEAEGLDPKEHIKAIGLRLKERKTGARVDEHQFNVSPTWGQITRHDERAEAKATQVAEEHYQAHEADYQAQAVQDAAGKGIETDFGSGSEE